MRRKIGLAGLMVALVATLVAPAASASTSSAGARSVDDCTTYLPLNLAISNPLPFPGQTVTITGVGSPGSTITLDLVMEGLPASPFSLGTVLVPNTGNFTKSTTIPAGAPPGVYTVRAKDPNCSQFATLDIKVRFADQRCKDYVKVFVHRGWTVTWKVQGVWRTNRPLRVLLVPDTVANPTVTIYNSVYPSNNRFTFTVPASIATGWYFVEERGTRSNGTSGTARCARLKVLDDSDTANDAFYLSLLASLLVSFSEPLSGGGGAAGGAEAPQVAFILLIGLVAVVTLRSLNVTKWRRRRNS